MSDGSARGPTPDAPAQGLRAGAAHYRAFVGPPETYDAVSANQFTLLTLLGLREHHAVLDIGCGSLRGGRLFIPYLLPGGYFGIEPEAWLIEAGINNELGRDVIALKRPAFSHDRDFTLSVFGRQFDFLLAQSIFSHASEPQIRTCLSQAKEVMKPTAVFAATFVEGDTDYTGTEWVYPGCVTYRLEHMAHLAGEHGLACRRIDWPHPAQQQWVLFTHPEHAEQLPALGDASALLRLEQETRFLKERLERIESHPYVKLGQRIQQLLRPLRRRG